MEDEAFLRHLDASVRAKDFDFLPPTVAEGLLAMQYRAREAQYAASHPNAESSIVICDGVDAGNLLVDRAENATRIVYIALMPEFRGRGVGTAILRSILDGGGPVLLQVRQDNPARNLYLRLGFAVASESEMDCEMRWG